MNSKASKQETLLKEWHRQLYTYGTVYMKDGKIIPLTDILIDAKENRLIEKKG